MMDIDPKKMSELERAIFKDWKLAWDKNDQLHAELVQLRTDNENLRKIIRQLGGEQEK